MYFLLTQSDKKYLRWLYKKIKVSYKMLKLCLRREILNFS